MNVLKTQVSLMQFLFIAVALIVFASAAEAQTKEFTQANMAVAQSAAGPIIVEPNKTEEVGKSLFINKTDKRCVVKMNAEGLFSIGCGDLGPSKTGRGFPKGYVVTIGKTKDKYGKGDEVSFTVAERK